MSSTRKRESSPYREKPYQQTCDESWILLLALGAILVFTPLARGSVHGWAITVLHLITVATLAIVLVRSSLTWRWSWIATPLDKPILALLVLTTVSTILSLHRETSLWSLLLLLNYVVLFYITMRIVVDRSQLRQLIYIIIAVAVFLAVFGMVKNLVPTHSPGGSIMDCAPEAILCRQPLAIVTIWQGIWKWPFPSPRVF